MVVWLDDRFIKKFSQFGLKKYWRGKKKNGTNGLGQPKREKTRK